MAAGNSGKRRTTTRKKTTASRKTTAKRKEENAFIRDEVTVLILFAVSVLLLISNFGVGGAAGSFVSGVMFGIFGIFAYILPVVLFLVTAFSISNRDNTIAVVKAAAMVMAGILLCAAFELIFGEKDGAGTVTAFYTYASEHKTGGGAVGGLLIFLTQTLGKQGVDAHADAHGEADQQVLDGEGQRQRRHRALRHLRNVDAVHHVVKRLHQHGYDHGQRHVGDQLPDGHDAHFVFL